MGDVIIAVVPAVGHEGLVADVPAAEGCRPERPMTVEQCACGAWRCRALHTGRGGEAPHGWLAPSVRALVLYAPGDPKLGMLRAMQAAGLLHVDMLRIYRDPFDVWFGGYPGRPVWMLPCKPPGATQT